MSSRDFCHRRAVYLRSVFVLKFRLNNQKPELYSHYTSDNIVVHENIQNATGARFPLNYQRPRRRTEGRKIEE